MQFTEYERIGLKIIEFWEPNFEGASCMLETVEKTGDPDITDKFQSLLDDMFITASYRDSVKFGDEKDIFDPESDSSRYVEAQLKPHNAAFSKVAGTYLGISITTYVVYFSFYRDNQSIMNELIELAYRLAGEQA